MSGVTTATRVRPATGSLPAVSGGFRSVWVAVGAAAVLVGLGVAHVAWKMAALNAGYRLGHVEEQHRALERQNRALHLQLATLRSAAHLEEVARGQLGMSTPPPQRVIAMGQGLEVVKVPSRPVAQARQPRPPAAPSVRREPVALVERRSR